MIKKMSKIIDVNYLQYLEGLNMKRELIHADRAWITFLLNYIPSEGDSLYSFVTTGAPGGFDTGPGIKGQITNGSVTAEIQQINGSLLSTIGPDIWRGVGQMNGAHEDSFEAKIEERTEQLLQARHFKVFDNTENGSFCLLTYKLRIYSTNILDTYTGRKLMVADRRDERGYSIVSNLVELKTNHIYFVHTENPGDVLSSSSGTYILATVKAIYSTIAEFEAAIPVHIAHMSAAWKAWGNREKKKEEVQAIVENEQKSMEELKAIWREKYVAGDSDETRFRVARIVWFERRSIEARKGRDTINVSFWGPWYPHHITGKYQFEGIVANDAFVAMVNTTSTGLFKHISRSEQVKLKSLPSRGPLLKAAAAKFNNAMKENALLFPNHHPTARIVKAEDINDDAHGPVTLARNPISSSSSTSRNEQSATKLSDKIDDDDALLFPIGNPNPSGIRTSTRKKTVTRKKSFVSDSEHDSVDAMSTESEIYKSSEESSGNKA